MNKLIRYLTISASLVAAAQAAPFMAVGDGAELFATGVLGVRADDNVLLAKNSEGDMIFEITPGLELTFGKNAQTQGALTISESFTNFADHDELNDELFNGDFVVKYDDGKMKLGANAGYHQINQNTVDVRAADIGRLIRRDLTTLGATGEVDASEITAVGAGINFRTEKYEPLNYSDSEILTVPVNFYYKWTPKIDVSLGLQYRDTQIKSGAGIDSIDKFYNIGARGEFSPKLTGKLAVGYTERRFSKAKDRSLFGVDASFAYELSPKSTAQFGVSNDFGTSPQGAQQKNTTVNVGFTTKLTEEWAANAGLSYRRIGYDGRSDDYYEFNLGAAYIVSANIRFAGGYVYRTYKSNTKASEFDNNVFAISANFRY